MSAAQAWLVPHAARPVLTSQQLPASELRCSQITAACQPRCSTSRPSGQRSDTSTQTALSSKHTLEQHITSVSGCNATQTKDTTQQHLRQLLQPQSFLKHPSNNTHAAAPCTSSAVHLRMQQQRCICQQPPNCHNADSAAALPAALLQPLQLQLLWPLLTQRQQQQRRLGGDVFAAYQMPMALHTVRPQPTHTAR